MQVQTPITFSIVRVEFGTCGISHVRPQFSEISGGFGRLIGGRTMHSKGLKYLFHLKHRPKPSLRL